MTVGDLMQEARRRAFRSLVLFLGIAAYAVALIYAGVHNYALLSRGVPPELIIFALLGLFGLEISAVALPLAVHFWTAPGLHRIAALAFYAVDALLLFGNSILDFHLNAGLDLSGLDGSLPALHRPGHAAGGGGDVGGAFHPRSRQPPAGRGDGDGGGGPARPGGADRRGGPGGGGERDRGGGGPADGHGAGRPGRGTAPCGSRRRPAPPSTAPARPPSRTARRPAQNGRRPIRLYLESNWAEGGSGEGAAGRTTRRSGGRLPRRTCGLAGIVGEAPRGERPRMPVCQHASMPGGGLGGGGRSPGRTASMPVCQHPPGGTPGPGGDLRADGPYASMPVCQHLRGRGLGGGGRLLGRTAGMPVCQYAGMPGGGLGGGGRPFGRTASMPVCQYAGIPSGGLSGQTASMPVCQYAGISQGSRPGGRPSHRRRGGGPPGGLAAERPGGSRVANRSVSARTILDVEARAWQGAVNPATAGASRSSRRSGRRRTSKTSAAATLTPAMALEILQSAVLDTRRGQGLTSPGRPWRGT
jgi:hypothetical protein